MMTRLLSIAYIYVSSTVEDLAHFRVAVQKYVRRLGAIDVSMENFGATERRPKDECLRLIREQTDIYVGIFAHRYGYIPEGDDISITEAEYRQAIASKIPCFIYLVDERAPWIPANIEKGRGATKLQKLVRELKTTHNCPSFSTPEDLAAQVAADVGRRLKEDTTRH
jgi:hypothetical protein